MGGLLIVVSSIFFVNLYRLVIEPERLHRFRILRTSNHNILKRVVKVIVQNSKNAAFCRKKQTN